MAGKLIAVDDEACIVAEILEALADAGYECVGAQSVDAAMEALEKDSGIRVVVTDMRMPDKSGADLIALARETFGRRLCFIVMSGHENFDGDSDKQELGIFDFVPKPVDINVLLDAIRRAHLELDLPSGGAFGIQAPERSPLR